MNVNGYQYATSCRLRIFRISIAYHKGVDNLLRGVKEKFVRFYLSRLIFDIFLS